MKREFLVKKFFKCYLYIVFLLGSHEIIWNRFWKEKIGKDFKEKQSVFAGKTIFPEAVIELFLFNFK